MIKKSVLILDVAVMHHANAMIAPAQTLRNARKNVIAAVVTPKHIFLATNQI